MRADRERKERPHRMVVESEQYKLCVCVVHVFAGMFLVSLSLSPVKLG